MILRRFAVISRIVDGRRIYSFKAVPLTTRLRDVIEYRGEHWRVARIYKRHVEALWFLRDISWKRKRGGEIKNEKAVGDITKYRGPSD